MAAAMMKFIFLLLLVMISSTTVASRPLRESTSYIWQKPPPDLDTYPSTLRTEIFSNLRFTGYDLFGLELSMKFPRVFNNLEAVTIFAPTDASINSNGGYWGFESNFMYHVVPNMRLTTDDLVSISESFTPLPTMDPGNNLVLTSTGPYMRLNNDVDITSRILFQNSKIVIHGVSKPLRTCQESVNSFTSFLRLFSGGQSEANLC